VIEKTQALISEDSGQSLRKLASIVGVSEPTMRRIAEEDLRYKLYTLKIRQILSEAARIKQVARCNLLSKEFWPPNSPDLNPLNYYCTCGALLKGSPTSLGPTSQRPNVTSLKTAIEAAFADIVSATLQCACERFRSRIETVIDRGYIE